MHDQRHMHDNPHMHTPVVALLHHVNDRSSHPPVFDWCFTFTHK